MSLPPPSKRLQNLAQRSTMRRQTVLNAKRYFREYFSIDDPFVFQFTKLHGQSVLGDARKTSS